MRRNAEKRLNQKKLNTMKNSLKNLEKVLRYLEELQADTKNFNGVVFDSHELDRIYSELWEAKEIMESEEE